MFTRGIFGSESSLAREIDSSIVEPRLSAADVRKMLQQS
jgi:hypothetical protein